MTTRTYDSRLRRQRQAELERRIAAAAATLHAQKGVRGTSYADIAAQANVSLPTVYARFPTQEALLAYYRGQQPELTDGYVSDPLDPALVAPHTTGGAVDLTLSWRGLPLALGTDYDAFEEAAHAAAFETPGADERVRDLRRLLARCLRAAGFSPYPWEWWHWSFGDQWWALDHGLTRSRYGVAAPT